MRLERPVPLLFTMRERVVRCARIRSRSAETPADRVRGPAGGGGIEARASFAEGFVAYLEVAGRRALAGGEVVTDSG